MPTLSRARRLGISAAALALPLSVLPLVSASADPAPPPYVSYLDTSAEPHAAALASADAVGSSAISLTPPGYQTRSYAVSEDGQTELIGLCHGTVTDCRTSEGAYDVTWALVLVHHDATNGTKSRVLSTYWDIRPALTRSGQDAVWLTNDVVYRLHVDYTSPDWATAGGTLTSSTAWAPQNDATSTWSNVALAVSPSGDNVAVMQSDDATPTPSAKILAGPFASFDAVDTDPFFYQEYVPPSTLASDTRVPSTHTFVFLDETHLAYGVYQPLDDPQFTVGTDPVLPLYTEVATLAPSGTGSHVENTALKNTYDLGHLGSSWYAWKDRTDDNTTVVTSFASASDVSSSGATSLSAFTDRVDGDVTRSYVPTSAQPPALLASDVASNRSAAHPSLAMRTSSVAYGKRAVYAAGNGYFQDPTGAAYDPLSSYWVLKGQLLYSIDAGAHWASYTTTTGKSPITVGTWQWTGQTQKLTRNTWFKWSYLGDLMTAPGSTSKRLVTVAPPITVKVARSGSYRIVYGSVLRSRGSIALLHKVGSRWRSVATVSISRKGAFSFGKKKLAKGSYKVVSLADTSWAASTTVFTV